jgi:hypothetical protein
VITLTKKLKDDYSTVYEFLDDLFPATGQIPVALFSAGSSNGVLMYDAVFTYPAAPMEREVPPPAPSTGRKIAQFLGMIKPRPSTFTPVERTDKSNCHQFKNFTVTLLELSAVVTLLLDNVWSAHYAVAGINLASDWWSESVHNDDEQFAALYDYATRGLQELSREWADHLVIEKQLLEDLADCKRRLTNAIGGSLATVGPTIEYVSTAYLARSWRFGNSLYADFDNLATTYHPPEIIAEISAYLSQTKEATIPPSQAFNSFIDNVLEIGPDFDNVKPPVPKTIRPEKKLENFLGAINDQVNQMYK